MPVPWLPTRPGHWIDFGEIWKELTPDSWPRGMFKAGSEARGDQSALGECLGYGRELLEWILQTIWAQRDDEALWLDRWETALGLVARTTTALRQSAILSYLRGYGAGDSEKIKSVFAEVFGGDVADVSFASPTAAEIASVDTLGDVTHSRWNNYLHIYSTNEDIDPDYDLADDLITQNKPTWQTWTVGRYRGGLYDKGTYDRCVYK